MATPPALFPRVSVNVEGHIYRRHKERLSTKDGKDVATYHYHCTTGLRRGPHPFRCTSKFFIKCLLHIDPLSKVNGADITPHSCMSDQQDVVNPVVPIAELPLVALEPTEETSPVGPTLEETHETDAYALDTVADMDVTHDVITPDPQSLVPVTSPYFLRTQPNTDSPIEPPDDRAEIKIYLADPILYPSLLTDIATLRAALEHQHTGWHGLVSKKNTRYFIPDLSKYSQLFELAQRVAAPAIVELHRRQPLLKCLHYAILRSQPKAVSQYEGLGNKLHRDYDPILFSKSVSEQPCSLLIAIDSFELLWNSCLDTHGNPAGRPTLSYVDPGQYALFTNRLWHAGGANPTDDVVYRIFIYCMFHSSQMPINEIYKPIPPRVAKAVAQADLPLLKRSDRKRKTPSRF